MSVLADKARRASALETLEKRLSSERLRLQGQSKTKAAADPAPASDPGTRFAAAVARAIPISSMPLWFYAACMIIVVLGLWLGAGAWVAATDPPRRISLTGSGIAGAQPFDQQEPPRFEAGNLQRSDVSIAPPTRLGEGVDEMAQTIGALRVAERASAEPQTTPETPQLAVAPATESAAQQDVASPAPEAAPKFGFGGLAMAEVRPSFDSLVGAAVPAAAPAQEAARESRPAKCLVKVSGRVQFERGCSVQIIESSYVLDLGDGKSATVKRDRGQTWKATVSGKSLGAVYRDGQCWGRKKEVYICAYGA